MPRIAWNKHIISLICCLFLYGHGVDAHAIRNKDPLTTSPDLQLQLKTSEIQLGELGQQMSSINQQLMNEQAALLKLKKAQQPFLSQLTKQNNALARQIRLAYQLGQTQSLKTILNPDNINTINRHLYYYHYLSEARLKLVTEIKQILDVLAHNMEVISQHEQNLTALLQEKQQQRHQQRQIQKQRQQIIVELHQHTQSRQQQLATSAANQKTLHDTLLALQSEHGGNSKQTFNHLSGKLQWPIKGPILASFGSWMNNQRLPGVIIKAPEDAPVHAIYSGKVIFANWLRGFGLLVIINHGNGYMSLYARNHTLFAKVGDTVKPRDVIATTGNSGGYTRSRLYFEIRQNGTPINPKIWCS